MEPCDKVAQIHLECKCCQDCMQLQRCVSAPSTPRDRPVKQSSLSRVSELNFGFWNGLETSAASPGKLYSPADSARKRTLFWIMRIDTGWRCDRINETNSDTPLSRSRRFALYFFRTHVSPPPSKSSRIWELNNLIHPACDLLILNLSATCYKLTSFSKKRRTATFRPTTRR